MALVVVSARVPAADAPVAGVPLTPYVLVRRGDGGAPPASGDDTHDEARGPPPGGGRYALRYRWFRAGLARGPAVCWAHPDREATIQVGMVGGGEGGRAWAWARRPSRGPRRRGVAGLAASSRRWSGFRNDTPTLAASLHPQCVACLRARAGDSRASYHCGPDCLRAHWPFHKELHETKRGGGAGAWAGWWGRGRRKGARCARARWPTLPPPPSSDSSAANAASNGYSLGAPDDAARGASGGGGGGAWVEVARGRSYTPGPDDVGACLRVEIVGVDVGAG